MKLCIRGKGQSDILHNKIDLGTHTLQIIDHMGGFDKNLQNSILNHLSNQNIKNRIETEYIIERDYIDSYPNLDLNFSLDLRKWLSVLQDYKHHPEIKIQNFLCSFNGTNHVSRQLLTAILYKFRYFTNDYCSKNFIYSSDRLDGFITNYCQDSDRFYRKFFISDDYDADIFYKTIYSFGHNQFDHANNIYTLENKLTTSFLHLVSETLATSYYPYVTEKFLYSVVTRGLFLSYAQPGWHRYLEKYYGFKPYTKLFDYKFDSIKNPIERLVELITMISKFSKLTNDELYDNYLMELDTIDFNYDHYFSGDFLQKMKQYE